MIYESKNREMFECHINMSKDELQSTLVSLAEFLKGNQANVIQSQNVEVVHPQLSAYSLIKDNIENKKNWQEFFPWILVGVEILAIIYILFWM